MEKNRIRPIKSGKSSRMSYSRQKEVLQMPNLIEVQKDSYQWFLDEGLKEVFDDISPIADYSGHLSLEFVDFTLCENEVKYTIDECKERDATYAAPLKVRVRLHNKETDEINEHEIFMGDLPLPKMHRLRIIQRMVMKCSRRYMEQKSIRMHLRRKSKKPWIKCSRNLTFPWKAVMKTQR